jgi:DNA-binding response OmpR family regulator
MKKILIVDDQPEVRELVEVTLSMGEYRILHAENGTDAVEMVREEKPDLTIMDILMPNGINGLEATRILKSQDETKGCRIIMLTSRGQEEEIEEGFEAGADDYFVKPFSPLQLIKKVEEYLG